MPLFDTHESTLAHLRDAHRRRRHWMFLADGDRAARFIFAFGDQVRERGLPDADLGYGCLQVILPVQRRHIKFSWLTAPKAKVRTKWVRELVESGGGNWSKGGPDRDIIPIGVDPIPLAGVYKLILDGRGVPADAIGLN